MSKVIQLNNIFKEFKIKAECINAKDVRNICTYDVILESGVTVKSLEKFVNEIGLKLLAKSKPSINIVPSQGIIKIEVVERDQEKISFWKEARKHKIEKGIMPFLIGESTNGSPVWVDFAKCPHTLIAGTTGSGKSTLLHTIIANAIISGHISTILVDPKNIEFSSYKNIKNVEVINSYDDTLAMLKNLVRRMESRYSFIKENDLTAQYFTNPIVKPTFKYILVIIDEYADLKMQDKSGELESTLCRLAQKSRAAGIHFVLATQRPSVDVLTGVIKANFPSRIACKVSSGIDSKVIIDSTGAEALNGYGDALIQTQEVNLTRFQAMFCSPDENVNMYNKIKKSLL